MSPVCHICGEELSNYSEPEAGSPGVGMCPTHGVTYDQTYTPSTTN